MVQGHCCFVCFSINQTYAGFYRVAQNFCGSLFLQILCVLWELIFTIRTDWFFLLEINFCDNFFSGSPGQINDNIFVFTEDVQ